MAMNMESNRSLCRVNRGFELTGFASSRDVHYNAVILKFQVINRRWFIQKIAFTQGIASYANFLEQKIILHQKRGQI